MRLAQCATSLTLGVWGVLHTHEYLGNVILSAHPLHLATHSSRTSTYTPNLLLRIHHRYCENTQYGRSETNA